ncbi:hypothetical protein QJS66_05455 [Kocuria rhizophila]|nr:hypothetical protein QJS66_05455 [Kocuria rhizophila]
MTDDMPGAAAAQVPQRTGRRCVVVALAVAATVLAADQLAKPWAVSSLVPGVEHPGVPGLLLVEHIRNSGGAFSLGLVTWASPW